VIPLGVVVDGDGLHFLVLVLDGRAAVGLGVREGVVVGPSLSSRDGDAGQENDDGHESGHEASGMTLAQPPLAGKQLVRALPFSPSIDHRRSP
jgi:hypothetical protein